MRIYFILLVVLFASNIKAENELIALNDYVKLLKSDVVFIYPRKPKRMPSDCSLVSLYIKNIPKKVKALSDVPKKELDNFIRWTKAIIKIKYVNKNISKEIVALPDIILLDFRMKNNVHVFKWISDILLVKNDTPIESYSWDSGSFFVFCITEGNYDFAKLEQVKKFIEASLLKYTNFPKNNLSSYKFNASIVDGVWQGMYLNSSKDYSSWKKYVRFVIGKNFFCLSFAELKEGQVLQKRKKPGDLNRF